MILYCDIIIGDKKMEKCNECGKKLGFMGGYKHPTLGRKHHLCSTCFDTVTESVKKYKEFIFPYVNYFNNGSSKRNYNKFDLVEISEQFTHTLGTFDRFSTEE